MFSVSYEQKGGEKNKATDFPPDPLGKQKQKKIYVSVVNNKKRSR